MYEYNLIDSVGKCTSKWSNTKSPVKVPNEFFHEALVLGLRETI